MIRGISAEVFLPTASLFHFLPSVLPVSPLPGVTAFQWAGFLVSWTACVDSLAENLLSSFVLFLEVFNDFRI